MSALLESLLTPEQHAAAVSGDRQFRARRGTCPLFASVQDAEGFDEGYRTWEWGGDMPSDSPASLGWLDAERSREMHVREPS